MPQILLPKTKTKGKEVSTYRLHIKELRGKHDILGAFEKFFKYEIYK